MIATARKLLDWRRLRPTGADLFRVLLAGSAWGLATSAGLAGMTAWNYGMICPDDIAVTTAMSVFAGILTIGPIAVYGRR